MLCATQVRVRMLRDQGISRYDFRLRPDDDIEIVHVTKRCRERRATLRVNRVAYHGWYSVIHAADVKSGRKCKFRLYVEPQQYGVIECRVSKRRNPQPQPSRKREGSDWLVLQAKQAGKHAQAFGRMVERTARSFAEGRQAVSRQDMATARKLAADIRSLIDGGIDEREIAAFLDAHRMAQARQQKAS